MDDSSLNIILVHVCLFRRKVAIKERTIIINRARHTRKNMVDDKNPADIPIPEKPTFDITTKSTVDPLMIVAVIIIVLLLFTLYFLVKCRKNRTRT